ncbi:MAG: hypothetical protein ACC642_08905 [Pseudomonadales bacterium]
MQRQIAGPAAELHPGGEKEQGHDLEPTRDRARKIRNYDYIEGPRGHQAGLPGLINHGTMAIPPLE